MTAGVICACAPSVATLYRRYPGHFPSVVWFTKLRSRFSKKASLEDGFDRVGSSHSENIRLETTILASAAKAEGRFIKSNDLSLVDWHEGEGHTTIEAWAH